ncbi:MAG: sensor histidine kinase [Bacteroidetes bacterium]|nr:MAG: sensor histidine kinase [Bacteroidota bacterium]
MTDVSHYMRTSLTIIKGEIEIVLQKNRKGEEYRKVFKLLEDESTHLQRIVENLSTLAYADAGALVSRKEIIDLTKICERQIEKVKVLKNRKNICLKASLQKNCYIYGDRNRIAELVFNLLENAIKYTPSHKTIFVELFKKESLIFLRIIDEGIGIEIKDLLKVFKRFYRSEAAKKLCKGTGLGLSICCSIVKSHDGELEISTCPGLGTCIEVRLKLITSFS